MARTLAAGLCLVLISVSLAMAQVPAKAAGRLLFTLGTTPAGSESYSLERLAGGGFRLSGDVDLQIPNLHIVQSVDVAADDQLAFQRARVLAIVNGDTTEFTLVRADGSGIQSSVQGDSTTTVEVETPDRSVLLSNNVIHHIVQFAWLFDGTRGESREFVAFPRIPVTAELQHSGSVESDGRQLAVRRYFLNIANRLGAYVWLAEDGTPLKVSVPLQAFEAVSEAHQVWAPLLSPEAGQAGEERPSPDYDAEEVRFESGDITLAGTLTLPRGSGPWPAAVLITGSGPQDRDENTPGPGGLKLGIFRSIADTLTRRGVAVLRYDDRGVGGSGGSLASAGLSDLVADVEAATRYLRGRSEIDPRRVALVGHSEGGIIAPIVAGKDTELAAVVLMAGTATPLDSVLVEQVVGAAREAGGDSSDLAESRELVEELSRAVREGRDLEATELPPPLKALADGQSKWLREHMEHDPLAAIKRVQAPVLIVNGGQDVQVAPEHARRLGNALDEALHPDHEVKVFPRLNHLFAVSRGEGTAEYADPNAEVDADFLSYLADWLTLRLARR